MKAWVPTAVAGSEVSSESSLVSSRVSQADHRPAARHASASASLRGHDFGRIPIYGQAPPSGQIQRKCDCAPGESCPSCEATAGREGAPPLQAKLEVSSPDDPLELEADRVADQVVNGGMGPDVGPENEADGKIQREADMDEREEEEEPPV